MLDLVSIANDSREASWKYPGWRVAIASLVALMFGPSTVAFLSFGLFIHPIETEFGWTRFQVSLATTIASFTLAAVSPIQGILVDRYGPRHVILTSIPLFGLGVSALYFLPPVPWIYYGVWILLPILGMGIFPMSYLRAASAWFERRLGLSIGIVNAGLGLGGTVIPFIVAFLIGHYGWRGAYLGLGLIVLVVTLPIAFLFVRDNPSAKKREVLHTAGHSWTFSEAASTIPFRLLSLAFFLLGVVTTALTVHQVPLLIDAGISTARITAVLSVYGVFVILGRFFTGFVLDYLPAALILSVISFGGATAYLVYGMGVNNVVVFPCAALLGMVLGAEFDVLGYMLKRYFGIASFGKIYGAIFAIFQLGAGFGTAALPYSRQIFGGYGPGLIAFSATALVVSALMIRLHFAKEPTPRATAMKQGPTPA